MHQIILVITKGKNVKKVTYTLVLNVTLSNLTIREDTQKILEVNAREMYVNDSGFPARNKVKKNTSYDWNKWG
jgi:hypothetical protein